jgi:general stress protein YciG
MKSKLQQEWTTIEKACERVAREEGEVGLEAQRAAIGKTLKEIHKEKDPQKVASIFRQYLAEIGRKGGQAKSPAKIAAARANAKQPRKRKPDAAANREPRLN